METKIATALNKFVVLLDSKLSSGSTVEVDIAAVPSWLKITITFDTDPFSSAAIYRSFNHLERALDYGLEVFVAEIVYEAELSCTFGGNEGTEEK